MSNILIPSKIILHCSATADSGTVSWGAIRRYHVEEKGWDDIGYHYGIEWADHDNIILQGRKPNRKGAHCLAAGRNSDSLGVCVVGDYDVVPPDPAKYGITIEFLAMLCFIFQIPPEEVYGHREFESGKTCPGLAWGLDEVRSDVADLLRKDNVLGGYIILL
jgi:hypothetical protein